MRKIMFLLITTVLFCGWGVNALSITRHESHLIRD